jgi:exopolyphosphatase / guanosine-5'-triphosphate,3'-diphosphate pyrophosphatase
MRVAVLDVGSNTVRLLVAERRGDALIPVREGRKLLLLGNEIERGGAISTRKLEEVRQCARAFSALAREAGSSGLDVVVTAPGRQADNAAKLMQTLADATGAPARVLSADEEGRLAWVGAAAVSAEPASSLAVCDVGGGSTEVVVGTREGGPAWSRSLDAGCLRLTERLLDSDPPGKEGMRRVREAVADAFDGLAVPLPQAAIATGGTARSLRKLIGGRLGADELAFAIHRLTKRTVREISSSTGVHRERAHTMLAGGLILAEVERRLATPLVVSSAGLREGVVLTRLAEAAAA